MQDASAATRRFRTAMAIAVCADAVQIVFSPLLAEGIASPLDDMLDVVACIVLTILMGWHYAFLPSFLIKIVPVVDLAPTWTIAVLLARRTQKRQSGPVIDVTATTEPTARPSPEALPERGGK